MWYPPAPDAIVRERLLLALGLPTASVGQHRITGLATEIAPCRRPPVRIVSKRTAPKLRTMAASMRVLLALSCCIGLTLAAKTADEITSLPGWDGKLPTKHYSG